MGELDDFFDRMELGNEEEIEGFDPEEVFELVLLFHSAGPWDEEKRQRWEEITGCSEATTKVLCDFVRAALAELKGEVHGGE